MMRTVLGFFKKEFVQVLRDPRMRILLFAVPIIQLIVFGLALKNEVKNVRLAVDYTKADDPILEHIIQRALASGWFIKADTKSDYNGSPDDAITDGVAEVVLAAPPEGVTDSLVDGKGKIQALIDSSNLLRAKAVENYLKAITQAEVTDYSKEKSEPRFKVESRILFNPTMNSSFFLVPGVLAMLITIVTVQLTSMALAKEKESGTFENLISAPISIKEILIGKTFPYFAIGCLDVPLVAAFAFIGFGVPMRGSYLELALASIFFVASTVSIGVLISTISKNQQQAMLGGFLFMFPANILSGVMFPIENMPGVLRILGYLNPVYYYLKIIRNIMLKGGDTGFLWINLGILALIAIFAMTLAYKRFKLTLS
jgi:ABC-2 type transport system permease protein